MLKKLKDKRMEIFEKKTTKISERKENSIQKRSASEAKTTK